ncbi:MAG TPA: 2-oxo acid dehydrogenase subunit E2 [Pseudonocardiaceae bacterium]|jgi:pyruvate dehydrogenase E2 component (dihydrolipoamide acetyltransferase)
MATLLRVPEVATGSTEAVLTEWLVPENEAFLAGAAIAVLETDKAAVEVEAEADAMILRRLVTDGSTVEVGTPIAVLGTAGEDITELLTDLSPAPSPPERIFASPLARKLLKEAGIAPAHVTGTGPNGRIIRKDAEAAIAQPRPTPPSPGPTTGSQPTSASQPTPSPQPPAGPQLTPARQPIPAPQPLPPSQPPAAPQPTPARQPLSATQPTTPQQSPPAAQPSPSLQPTPARQPTPPPTSSGFTDIPHGRIRYAIATRLTASKQTIPHFYLRRTARIDDLLALRKQLNSVSPTKISVNDLIIKAVATAHRAIPDANVIWTDDALRRYDTVDIGVAIASSRGLVTPVLRAVESSSLSMISHQVKEFAHTADNGKLMQRDLDGGTITVSNLGMYKVDEFAAIINPPQSAILAVGAGKPGPAVVDGELTVATQLTLVLSVDHRAIDGALAAQWMGELVAALEQPLRLVA